MDKKTVQFKRKVMPVGNSQGHTYPKELLEFLGAKMGSDIIMSGFSGKHGKYIAVWVDENGNQ